MLRAEVLDTAKKAVCKDRQNAYGPPERNFEDIARMASVALGKPLTALDIAKILCCVKLARMKSSPYHSDNYVDLAGYAACAAEVASAEQTQTLDSEGGEEAIEAEASSILPR